MSNAQKRKHEVEPEFFPSLQGPLEFKSGKYKAAVMHDERRNALITVHMYEQTRTFAQCAQEAAVKALPSCWCWEPPEDAGAYPTIDAPGAEGDWEHALDNFEPGRCRRVNIATNPMAVGLTTFAWVTLLQNGGKGFCGYHAEASNNAWYGEHVKLIATHAVGKKKARLAASLTPAQIKRYEACWNALTLGLRVARGPDWSHLATGHEKGELEIREGLHQQVRDETLRVVELHKHLLPPKLYALACTPDERPFLLAKFCMLLYVHFEEDYPKAVKFYRCACRVDRFAEAYKGALSRAKDPVLFRLYTQEITLLEEVPECLRRLGRARNYMEEFLATHPEPDNPDNPDPAKPYTVTTTHVGNKLHAAYDKRLNQGARQVRKEASARAWRGA
jgi:hypothetical protein